MSYRHQYTINLDIELMAKFLENTRVDYNEDIVTFCIKATLYIHFVYDSVDHKIGKSILMYTRIPVLNVKIQQASKCSGDRAKYADFEEKKIFPLA